MPVREMRLPGMFGFDKCFQAVKTGAPEAAVLVEPRLHSAQGLGIQFVKAVASFAMFADEVGATEKAQVFGDGGAGNGKGSGNLSGGLAAAAEEIEDGTAGRIGQGLEGGLGAARRRICNRMVTHNV